MDTLFNQSPTANTPDLRAASYSAMLGSSPAMQHVFEQVAQVAPSPTTVLIMGETGTGKELVARALHQASLRRNQPMIKLNCAAIPANLMESELFGHERGSFTGATEQRTGKFELADNSTLFLDEIGELPPDLQVKLLRVLQEREFERIGGRSVIKTDVRIIAATNRNLYQEVLCGRFRSDLYYRLHVFPIVVPPLRQRVADILPLATHFLVKHAQRGVQAKLHFSNAVLQQLLSYSWPGNVRELEHLVERSILQARGPLIDEIDLPVNGIEVTTGPGADSCIKTIEELERLHILAVLKLCHGKVKGAGGAAEKLQINANTLNSKIKKLGIKKGLTDY